MKEGNVLMSPVDNLERYLREIRGFPMLSAENEQELARRWRDRQDPEALRQLVGSHLRLAFKIARGYRGYGLPLGDLIAEGNLGLMQAATRFDPDRGFRFATYAVWWVRATIQEYILHNWSLVKIGTTAAQKKLFFNLRALKGRLEELEEGDLSPATVRGIATELEVPEAEVVEMNRRLGGDRSLNAMLAGESDTEWQDLLADDRPQQDEVLVRADELAWRRGLLEQGLAKLNPRERHILSERQLSENPRTLDDLSREYAISRERVRQIEARALEKLQKSVLQAANDAEAAAA
ncbi:MAG: RNA polymerase sigma factor RpoH [Rhodospirillales bacterium]|nr:RNA polymerase sigma factor RpoH [Rhodospirillales bacterium]